MRGSYTAPVRFVGGQIEWADRDEFVRAVRGMKDGDGEVTVGPAHRDKTYDQVKYWFAVPVPLLAEHCGTTVKRMHRDLLGECFGYETNGFGKVVPIKPSLADLTVEETADLIDWVLIFGPTELGVVIPPPDKDWKSRKGEPA